MDAPDTTDKRTIGKTDVCPFVFQMEFDTLAKTHSTPFRSLPRRSRQPKHWRTEAKHRNAGNHATRQTRTTKHNKHDKLSPDLWSPLATVSQDEVGLLQSWTWIGSIHGLDWIGLGGMTVTQFF